MQRPERCAVFEITRNGTDDDARAVSAAGPDDVGEVLLKVRVNPRHAGVILPDLIVDEHGHALPFPLLCGDFGQAAQRTGEQLSDSSAPESDARPNHSQSQGLPAEDGAASEWAYPLVVAHINHPDVPLLASAIAGDRQDDIRVDSRHGNVDHFDFGSGIPVSEEHLQHPRETKLGFRIAVSSGFAKNKDPASPRQLKNWELDWPGRPGQYGAKKPPTESLVFGENRSAVNLPPQKKRSGIASADQA